MRPTSFFFMQQKKNVHFLRIYSVLYACCPNLPKTLLRLLLSLSASRRLLNRSSANNEAIESLARPSLDRDRRRPRRRPDHRRGCPPPAKAIAPGSSLDQGLWRFRGALRDPPLPSAPTSGRQTPARRHHLRRLRQVRPASYSFSPFRWYFFSNLFFCVCAC